ncbi:MAG TPA: aspartate dehydrogenase domain-containing protein, partial [Ramlibacter sp.]|nr:aspartate dehydrogenase domain-containing protein [Ramlibacter sp.]
MKRRLAIVGAGRIGAPVLAAELPGWQVVGVLVRQAADRPEPFTSDLDEFLAKQPDLIVELAGPAALAAVGERCLAIADVWTVSPAALADAAVAARLESAARASGHRLRILPGAFAGLDGVSAASAAGGASLHLDIDLMPGPGPAELRFSGTVREAAARYPNAVNIAVAAALAGPGLD